jgi:hypothetical protein
MMWLITENGLTMIMSFITGVLVAFMMERLTEAESSMELTEYETTHLRF